MCRKKWMQRCFVAGVILAVAGLIGSPMSAADDEARQVSPKQSREISELQQKVPAAIRAMLRQDSTLQKLFDSSPGYVVFPNIGKGGLVFGGAHGKGLVYEDGRLVGLAYMSQATVGAQIGAQVYREAIFFESADAILAFKQSNVELSAQLAAVAAAEGAAASARYSEGVIIYIDPIKGLMAEASVGGQKFTFTPIEP